MKNIVIAFGIICLIVLATVSGCRGNSSSIDVETPSYKYTVTVSRGMPNGGTIGEKYQTDIFIITSSGVQFKDSHGKVVCASDYVVIEN